MGSLSDAEQKKLAYFHALGRVMTEGNQNVYESKYKSSHNVRLNEVWSDEIGFAANYTAAVIESVSNSAVTLYTGVTLTELPGSNGQVYYYNSGGTFVRPWISPVDVPNTITNNPSTGYQVKLFKGDNTEISITQGAWTVDYYAGIIHFAIGYTPANLGWGAIKATFFQYTGHYGASGSTSGNAFTTVSFNSGTSQLIFNSGITNQQIIDLSTLSDDTTSLSTALSTEVSTRGSVDSSLSTALSSVISGNTYDDTSLSTGLSTEAYLRGSVDNSLSTALSSVVSGNTYDDTSLSTAISIESSSRTSDTTSLSTALSSVISGNTYDDSSLSTAISIAVSNDSSLSTTISTAISNEVSLSTTISTEESTRTSKDNSLSTTISTVESTRASVDNSLSTIISTVESTRASVDNSLSTTISTEESVRTSVDNSLSTAILTISTSSGFTAAVFDSGTSQLIFNSGTPSMVVVDLSSLSGGTGGSSKTSFSNINMSANTTLISNGQLACNTGITSTPLTGSYVSVYVNGIQVNVSDGDLNKFTYDCYFSTDGGTTGKDWNNIAVGDLLYWNSITTGYPLSSATDKISFIYLIL